MLTDALEEKSLRWFKCRAESAVHHRSHSKRLLFTGGGTRTQQSQNVSRRDDDNEEIERTL